MLSKIAHCTRVFILFYFRPDDVIFCKHSIGSHEPGEHALLHATTFYFRKQVLQIACRSHVNGHVNAACCDVTDAAMVAKDDGRLACKLVTGGENFESFCLSSFAARQT